MSRFHTGLLVGASRPPILQSRRRRSRRQRLAEVTGRGKPRGAPTSPGPSGLPSLPYVTSNPSLDPSVHPGSSGNDTHTKIPWDRSCTGRCSGAGPAPSMLSGPGGAVLGVGLSLNGPRGSGYVARKGRAATVDVRGPQGSGGEHSLGRCAGAWPCDLWRADTQPSVGHGLGPFSWPCHGLRQPSRPPVASLGAQSRAPCLPERLSRRWETEARLSSRLRAPRRSATVIRYVPSF